MKKKPLSRSITISCVAFIVFLCLFLGIVTHLSFKNALYQRYESYITDILHYIDRHIDDDDLSECTKTLVRSKKFDELELFMDGVKEDFDIHYLYIIKPLNTNDTANFMSVISAENYYDRYVDTEGNLYLGWISDDEYDADTMKKIFRIMEKREIAFFEEKTDWGTDYTGALSLYDSKNTPYALLAVDVDISSIKNLIQKRTAESFAIIISLGLVFTLIFLYWANKNLTKPILSLEKSVVEFAKKSHGQRNLDALSFDSPQIDTKNEVASLASAINQMTADMREYVRDIILAEKKADQMSELANKDALTGIRNKTAYDKEIKRMEYSLGTGEISLFGIAMIDLNFLKRINDTYGHEQGNFAIKKLCFIVCKTFQHSPVFRIGGDEFVVILRGDDFANIEKLLAEFRQKLSQIASDENLEPWEKVSAAIGTAFYDPSIDANVLNVFRRADQAMYECKKEMKAVRE